MEQMGDARTATERLRERVETAHRLHGISINVDLDLLEALLDALTAARIEGEREGLERAAKMATKHAEARHEQGLNAIVAKKRTEARDYSSMSIAGHQIAADIDALAKELPHDPHG